MAMGRLTANDPECVGPCDNDEGKFATGIPGDNIDACKQDCFLTATRARVTTAAIGT